MKNLGLSFVAIFFFGILSGISYAQEVTANCVGGPDHPSYAFSSPGDADRCANKVASFSEACRTMVQNRECETNRRNVNVVSPDDCACGDGSPNIGNW
jgi:hypothetical protein